MALNGSTWRTLFAPSRNITLRCKLAVSGIEDHS